MIWKILSKMILTSNKPEGNASPTLHCALKRWERKWKKKLSWNSAWELFSPLSLLLHIKLTWCIKFLGCFQSFNFNFALTWLHPPKFHCGQGSELHSSRPWGFRSWLHSESFPWKFYRVSFIKVLIFFWHVIVHLLALALYMWFIYLPFIHLWFRTRRVKAGTCVFVSMWTQTTSLLRMPPPHVAEHWNILGALYEKSCNRYGHQLLKWS